MTENLGSLSAREGWKLNKYCLVRPPDMYDCLVELSVLDWAIYGTVMFCIRNRIFYLFPILFLNEIIRKYFIADALDLPVENIRSVRLLNTFLWRRYHWQKQGILDVLVEFNDDTKINIELQIIPYAYWDKRCIFYLAKMYTEDLLIGQKYDKLKKCINISVLDFDFTHSPEYHTVYRLRDKKGNEFSDVLEIHIIELCKELKDGERMNDWIRLINANSEEELNMIQT